MDWENKIKAMLKAELKRKNITYEVLVEKLKEIGVKESTENINNKINRGKFSAVFFMQCLEAIGTKNLRIEE